MQIRYPWYNLFCTADYTPEAVRIPAPASCTISKFHPVLESPQVKRAAWSRQLGHCASTYHAIAGNLSEAILTVQVVATLVPCFQQWTGINSIMFYAPIIFKTINPQSGALLATMITGVINVLATFISIAFVEKAGRKVR